MKKLVYIVALGLMLTGNLQANLIVNGNFEATPYSQGWSSAGTVSQTSGLFSSTNATQLTASATGRLYQAFTGSVRSFEYSFNFRPDVATGNRTLNNVVYSSGSTGGGDPGALFNLRSGITGNLEVFSNNAWQVVHSSAFSVGSSYSIKLIANDWGFNGANNYQLFWSNANSQVLSNSSGILSFFQNTPNILTNMDGVGAIAFIRASGNGSYTVDNVTLNAVPEPGALTLAGLAVAAIGFVRRRRR